MYSLWGIICAYTPVWGRRAFPERNTIARDKTGREESITALLEMNKNEMVGVYESTSEEQVGRKALGEGKGQA